MRYLLLLFLCSVTNAASVTDFGALPDDGMDDRAAIQAAINAGGEVHFPPGEYHIGQSGNSPWGLDVGGTNNVVLIGYGATLKQLPSGRSVRLISSQSAPVRGLKIIGLTLDGQKSLQGADEQRHGIFLSRASNVRITNVTARNFAGDGIYIYDGGSDIGIGDCSVYGNDRNGITIGGSVSGLRVRGCDARENRAQQFDSEAHLDDVLDDVSITESTFIATTDFAVTLGGPYGTPGTNWRFIGNHVKSDSHGVRIIYADGIVFQGNTIESGVGPYSGVQVYNWNDNVVISGNTITSKSVGVNGAVSVIATTANLSTNRALIIGNAIVGNIWIQGANEVMISNNHVDWIYLRSTFPIRIASVTGNITRLFTLNGHVASLCVLGNSDLKDNCNG